MRGNGKMIAFFGGILICIIICMLPLSGISPAGQLCLGLTLMTVIWWASQVASVGYISGIYLMLLYLFKLAPVTDILTAMTGSIVWLMMSVYLISSAVRSSGLGERLAYFITARFIHGWKSLIVTVFILQFVLSVLIPHPFPRSFLIMAVMDVVIRATKMSKQDAVTVGFTVFASSVPVSLIFITSDATISPLAASYASTPIGFISWFIYFGVPAIILSVLTFVLILVVFPNSAPVSVNLEEIRSKQEKLGKMTNKEIRCIIWGVICVISWVTNSVTGLDIGYATFFLAMLMSLPKVGEVLDAKAWNSIPLQVAIFITAAIAIGKVGGMTGMNAWIANTLIPESLPNNIFLLGFLILSLTIILHMFMGSVIAVMGVAMPIFLSVCQQFGVPEVVMIGIVYLGCAGHYLLPFHHLTLVVGQGEENGGFTQKETFKMGLPLTLALFITVILAIGYWKLIGLL